MIGNMDAVKAFVLAGSAAVGELVQGMTADEQRRVADLFVAGNMLAISLVVRTDGSSSVSLEAILDEGSRLPIASVNGKPRSIQ